MIEVSAIVASYNRSASLRECLKALLDQAADSSSYEVVVVIDGSTDDTVQMTEQFRGHTNLRVLQQTNRGHPQSLNVGAEAAHGQVFVFLDDDIVVNRDFISEHATLHRAQHDAVGLGHLTCDVRPDADQFAYYMATWWREHYLPFTTGLRRPSFMDCYSGNMSVRRTAFACVGGFTTDIRRSYDVELGYRLAREGLRFVYLPRAVGQQHYRKSRLQIAADAQAAGVAALDLYRKHPAMLPHMQLGAFNHASPRIALLRRALLAGRVPPWALIVIGALLRGANAHRWHRFLYSYCYWRGVRYAISDRQTWIGLIRGTVVLMYHAIGDAHERASRYVVPSRRFSLQMAWLRWRRYSILRLEDFIRSRTEYCIPPGRSVVITFDDGYDDNRTLGLPLWRKCRIPVTIFVVSGLTGRTGAWSDDVALSRRPLMTRQGLQELVAEGCSIGAHSRTHPRLTALPADKVHEEVAGSRHDLIAQTGTTVESFAYPYGRFDDHAIAAVQAAGFSAACGIRPGANSPATPAYQLRRIEIRGTDSILRFAMKLHFAVGLRGVASRQE